MAEEQPQLSVKEQKLDYLIAAVDRAYSKPRLMMWRSFLHGFMTALGATVGTALFFTILIWIFQALGGVELLKPGVEKLQNLIIPKEFQLNSSSSTSLSDLEQQANDLGYSIQIVPKK